MDGLIWLFLAAIAYGAATFLLSRGNAFGHLANLQFAMLQSLLLVGCFQWSVRPLRGRRYDYTSPLALVAVWTFVFFGIGSLLPWIEPTLREGLHNPGAIEYYPRVLAPVVLGIFIWDWVYRPAHRALVPPEHRGSVEPGLNVWLKALFTFWVTVTVAGYLYLASRYTQVGLSFVPSAVPSAQLLPNAFDNALNQIMGQLLLLSWALSAFVYLRAQRRRWRWAAIGGGSAILLLLVSMLSRRRILVAGLILLGVWLYQKRPTKQETRRLVLKIGGAVVAIGVLVSAVRVAYGLVEGGQVDQGTDPGALLAVAQQVDPDSRAFSLGAGQFARYTLASRLVGLDLPAAAYAAHRELGAPYLHGDVNLLAGSKVLPRFLWSGKTTRSPKKMSRDHLSLPDVDHINTLVSSAFLDFGGLGVVMGFGILALLMAGVEGFIWHQKLGAVLYYGSLTYPAEYESYILAQPFLWFRFILLIGSISFVVAGVANRFRSSS